VSEAHEAGLARFLKPSRAARWRAARHDPDDLHHFASRFDPAYAEVLEMHTKHEPFVAEVLARLAAEGAGETCVLFHANGDDWGAAVPVAEAVPDLLWDGAGIASFVPGRLALYVGEDGSDVVLLRRA
jgi:hypothetical protein